MDIALITGSAGLVGSESVRFFAEKGFSIVGIDNDMRGILFGDEASTAWNLRKIQDEISDYTHYDYDICDNKNIKSIFKKYGQDIKLVIHAAAQPSHDWAAKDPMKDFSINATGTLVLLEMTRIYCQDAVFIFTSTNKVYGDNPNYLPLLEHETRYELTPEHVYYENGIDEQMSIDQTKHSVFGVSKLAADVMVQEYGRYFNLKTSVFRGGCLTGPDHSGTELHGYLSYVMKCAMIRKQYVIFGYKGKQVRDNIHSYDLVNAFWHVYQNPRVAEVYNIGGGRFSNCSILEAFQKCENIVGDRMRFKYLEDNRIGDHIWWISDMSKFKKHYPDWDYKFSLDDIFEQIFLGLDSRI